MRPYGYTLVSARCFRFNRAMLKALSLFIGLRYIRSKRRNGFVSFVSGFSFGAMALGVMALIAVLSVMNGFAREIHSRVLNVIPHIAIQRAAGLPRGVVLPGLAQQPEVLGVAPYIEGFGMLRSGAAVQGVSVQGIDPAAEAAVTQIAAHMLVGELELLQPGEFGVVLGSMVARSLGVVTGDSVRLTLPEVSRTLAGVFPREKNLRVTGVFEVGAQVDSGLAFVHIDDAGRLYRRGDQIDGLRVRISEPLAAAAVARQLEQQLGDAYQVTTWGDQLGSLFTAMRMEKIVIGLLLSIVIAVAAFNIVANLVLMVAEKRKDIAVLRSMGMRARSVMRVFMVQGTSIGVLGILVDALLGCALGIWIGDLVAWFENLFGVNVFDPQVYFVSTLPSQLQALDVLLVCSGALLMSVLATLYPSWQASRVQPAEALRYDR